jgi:hypothetical protein
MKTNDNFICDNCGQFFPMTKDSHYPFEAKWLYLHELNFKVEQKKFVRFSQKHFCKLKCAAEFIMKKLMEENK